MSQLTLSVPPEKLPVLTDFLNILGIDDKNIQPATANADNIVKRELNALNSFFRTYFNWEYYCNELEFE
ncbi:MAG: hypothetical protein H0X70_05355 [Segetibacter sp.]|jgi:hypothetical protein|nr:hypothetical protein [Segetibacter sp.]